MSERRLTKREYREFREYLKNCTDAQVYGVYQKEKLSGRRNYINMVLDEVRERGFELSELANKAQQYWLENDIRR